MLAVDGLASLEGIEAPLKRRIRLEMLAGDAMASLEGIEAPSKRRIRLEFFMDTPLFSYRVP